MAYHPKLSQEQRERIRRIANIRNALPTDKELAREMGVTPHAVRRWMRKPKAVQELVHHPNVQTLVPSE